MANLDFPASEIANKDDIAEAANEVKNQSIPRPTYYGSPAQLAVVFNDTYATDENGNFKRVDDADFRCKYIDGGDAIPKENVENASGWLAQRDSKGNLWTGSPVDDQDCVNKKFVEVGFVPQKTSNGMTYEVYALSPGGNCKLEVEDNDLFECAGSYGKIPYRQSNGNLMTNTPTKDLDCVNKAYVDVLKTEIDELRAMIEELKG